MNLRIIQIKESLTSLPQASKIWSQQDFGKVPTSSEIIVQFTYTFYASSAREANGGGIRELGGRKK